MPALFLRHLAEGFYPWVALGASLVFLVFAAGFAMKRTNERARVLVIVSVIYLPVVLITLVLGS